MSELDNVVKVVKDIESTLGFKLDKNLKNEVYEILTVYKINVLIKYLKRKNTKEIK